MGDTTDRAPTGARRTPRVTAQTMIDTLTLLACLVVWAFIYLGA